ncbi:MAG: serine dehydratase subunit alpha family protein [Dehalococcoidia bacterium]|nr:serine dehydratase subunit alpha family protein [Dehalococcoidia bacterium]
MNEQTRTGVVDLLHREVVPAGAVQETLAIALAAARAARAIGGEVERVRVWADPVLFKMAYSLTIPGTGETGILMAAALGAVAGKPAGELKNVLAAATAEDIETAHALVSRGAVEVQSWAWMEYPFVRVSVASNEGEALAVTRGSFENVSLVLANDVTVMRADEKTRKPQGFEPVDILSVEELVSVVRGIRMDDIAFLLDAAHMNLRLATIGMTGAKEGGIARGMLTMRQNGTLAKDLRTEVELHVIAAEEARVMSEGPVMTLAGSGSHGIAATLPVAVVAGDDAADDERLARALALSFLITLKVKSATGRLTALCGCAVASATGSAAGLVLLKGGTDEQVGYAIRNIAADIPGMVCDGLSAGCALKASTGAGAAVRAAFLALGDVVVPADTGISFGDPNRAIATIGRLAREGMAPSDIVLADAMTDGLSERG